jgi:hypothetical protein
MAVVKIVQPSKKNVGELAMPATFAAFGTATGPDVGTVRAQLKVGDQEPIPGKLLTFRVLSPGGSPAQVRYGWVMLFQAKADKVLSAVLTVIPYTRDGVALDKGTDTVEFQVRPLNKLTPPTITYPPSGYLISGGERDYFMPFGGSDLDMADVSLGGVSALFTGWDSGVQFWYSVFGSLTTSPGPGSYTMIVSNTKFDAAQPVGVDDH